MGKEYQEAWEQVTLSHEADERIRRTLMDAQRSQNNVIALHKEVKMKKTAGRAARTALIAAVMALALSVSAFAVANYTGFFDAFFGTGAVAPSPDTSTEFSQEADGTITVEAHDYTYEDEAGSYTYTMPGYQLVEVDEDEANRLLGAYVTELDDVYTVDGYTVTMLGYIEDEAGSARLYYSIENPDGLENIQLYDVNGYTNVDPVDWSGFKVTAGGSTAYADLTKSTDTKVYVCVPMAVFQSPDGILADLNRTVRIFAALDGSVDYEPPVEEFTVGANKLVLAVTAAGESYEVAISPMGLHVASLWQGEFEIDGQTETVRAGLDVYQLTVTMADGTEYVVESKDSIRNTSYQAYYDGEAVFCFNRIIDPAEVASVTVTGLAGLDDDGLPVKITETVNFAS